ncbi:MAG: S8 family serine peptidase [Pseudomonadota bacterium]|nr:S8 family serine peptidase [Pseudomonadota bacterium]
MQFKKIVLALAMINLTACGGGGGSSSTTDPITDDLPTTSITYSVRFESPVEGASYVEALYDVPTYIDAGSQTVLSSYTQADVQSLLLTGETVTFDFAPENDTYWATIHGSQWHGGRVANNFLASTVDSGGNVTNNGAYYPDRRLTQLPSVVEQHVQSVKSSVFPYVDSDGNKWRVLEVNAVKVNEGLPGDYFADTMPSTNMGKSSKTGNGVKVTVVEYGFDKNHPVLSDPITSGRWYSERDDYVAITDSSATGSFAETAEDRMSHGTAVTSAVIGQHQLFDVTDQYIDNLGTLEEITGTQFTYGFGSATDSEVTLLEAAFTTNTVIQDLVSDVQAQTALSGTQVFNVSQSLYFPNGTNSGDHDTQQTSMESWRSGQGYSLVVAASNEFSAHPYSSKQVLCDDFRNEVNDTDNTIIGCGYSTDSTTANNPFAIVVGALNMDEEHAHYSSIGANLWVSALGNQMLSAGLPATTKYWEGTSFAAPIVSGVVAQMLEANPALDWRDVRHLLAEYAIKVNADQAADVVNTDFGAFTLNDGWKTNAAGYSYNNFYGFGGVDVVALTNAATAYTSDLGAFVTTGVINSSLATPTYVEEGLTPTTVTFDVTSGDGVNNVESLVIHIQGQSNNSSGVIGELESPSGTKFKVLHSGEIDAFTSTTATDFSKYIPVNAFYGESAVGQWKLHLHDLTASPLGSKSLDEDTLIEVVTVKIYGQA